MAEPGIAELLVELKAMRQVQEAIQRMLEAAAPRAQPRSVLNPEDRTRAGLVLPLIFEGWGNSAWAVGDLRDPPIATVQEVLSAMLGDPKQNVSWGKLFGRCADHIIDGLVVRRAVRDNSGRVWFVERM
ncbi:MAG: hypothetical protein Q8R33_15540 [Burkholderiales bacterium]|nr:hypothetical protein [Burkholderiales bacterium]